MTHRHSRQGDKGGRVVVRRVGSGAQDGIRHSDSSRTKQFGHCVYTYTPENTGVIIFFNQQSICDAAAAAAALSCFRVTHAHRLHLRAFQHLPAPI